MLHAGGRGECGCSSGLGIQAEDPTALANEFVFANKIFQGALQRMPSGNTALAREAMLIQNWFNTASADMAKKDFRNARIKIRTVQELVHIFAQQVGEATVAGGAAQTRAQTGGSILNQALATFGLIPEASIYRPEMPAAEALEGFGKWLLPIGAGLLLILLLRR